MAPNQPMTPPDSDHALHHLLVRCLSDLAQARGQAEVLRVAVQAAWQGTAAREVAVYLPGTHGWNLADVQPPQHRPAWPDRLSALEELRALEELGTQEELVAQAEVEAQRVFPLVAAGRTLGALALRRGQDFTVEEEAWLQPLRSACALALAASQESQAARPGQSVEPVEAGPDGVAVTERAAGQTLREYSSALERQVQERTQLLERHVQAQDAFVTFVEAAGTETDALTLAQRAVDVLHRTLPQASAAFYELEGGLWKARAWSPDIPPEVVERIREGLPEDSPSLAAARNNPDGLFNDGWNAEDSGLAIARTYGAGAFLPLERQPPGLLTVGTRHAHPWTAGERSILRGVGRSLGLALERSAVAQQLRQQNTELEARTRALEGFAELTRDIDFQSDPYALIGRAQQVLLSLTPPGYADYFELHGGKWWSKVRTGERRNAQLQATVDAGLPYQPLANLRLPFETRQPYYQSTYDQQTDGLADRVQQLGATATLPVCVNGEVHGILAVGLFDPYQWSSADRAVLETVVHALQLALEGARGVMALRHRTQELERSNHELEQFAYVASHDLQEPLRTVTSFTQLLLKRLDVSDPKAQRYAQFVMEGTDRMSRLIRDLLEFSRVSTQGREPTHVDMKGLVEQVVHDLSVQIEQTQASVQFGDLPAVKADGTQVGQLFQNLIGNALKFTVPGRPAVVQVSAERDGQMIRFRVQDNGIGIAPEYFGRIFTIFQRLHHRAEYEGSGIGLSIARRIVERHGGTIWLESTPGQGTTFLFTLPEAR